MNHYEACAEELAKVREHLGLPPADPALFGCIRALAELKAKGLHVSASRTGLVTVSGHGFAQTVFLKPGPARQLMRQHRDIFNF